MKKISTLFKKDPNDLSRVINEVDPENVWALTQGTAFRKWDGTAMAIIVGDLYKRYDAKNGKPAPLGGIPCQDPDPISGHWPFWVKCDRANVADKWAWLAFDNPSKPLQDGTFELCGPKVQGNPESLASHDLIRHDDPHWIEQMLAYPLSFESIKERLSMRGIEGFVFHNTDGRMCKIRKSDFGLTR